MNTEYVMGMDPISSEKSSVSINLVKLRKKGSTSELTPEKENATLYYQQMDPEYVFPYDAEGVKQKLWDEMTDETKAKFMAIKILTEKAIENGNLRDNN